MYKCFLCPTKNATLADDALKCLNCGVYYHPSCGKRAKRNNKGVFEACCGNVIEDTDIDEQIENLDLNLQTLYKLLSKKIDDNYNKFRDSLKTEISNIKSKMNIIEERLDELEYKATPVVEDIIGEIQDRKSRERNIILYNVEDSKNAEIKDKKMVSELIKNCSEEPPFDMNNISVVRMGGKWISGKNRALKVTLPSIENVHWMYKNKKEICNETIYLSGDLTKKQREYRTKVINELNQRKKNGEGNIYI